jgi:deoxyribodipyrimidine photolyase-like uncharacterized protein
MRGSEPFLFHSQLSGLLNLHLLTAREALDAVLENPHERRFQTNARMKYPYQNLARKSSAERAAVRRAADAIRTRLQ